MKKSIVLVTVIATFLFGCKNGEKNEISSEENMENVDASSTEMDSHNSENSLDWLGVYEGTIPCADCEGVTAKGLRAACRLRPRHRRGRSAAGARYLFLVILANW